jgi:hypothetical protein
MNIMKKGDRYVHKAKGGEFIYVEGFADGTAVFARSTNPAETWIFKVDRMLPVKDDPAQRMQLDLRRVVQLKIDEGFEVIDRDPNIKMQRGSRKISVELFSSATFPDTVIIKNL